MQRSNTARKEKEEEVMDEDDEEYEYEYDSETHGILESSANHAPGLQ